MFIQRILRNAVLAELLLFLMVANCAPSRPREDVGRVPGNPASSYHPSVINNGSHSSRSRTNKSQPNRKGPILQGPIDSALVLKDPPNEIGFRRVYRWSTGCSIRSGADLLRFLPNGSVDARGDSSDPDTDIELSSISPDGKVYILSKTRKIYLCFTKKGKLVTRKRPGGDKTLCQFYETLWQGNRRFVSVYRRQQRKGHQQHQPAIPWPVPIPGTDRSWKDGLDRSSVGFTPMAEVDDWQVGFSRSGDPLKGSAWRQSKNRNCFDLVEHADHVNSSGKGPMSPIGRNQMSSIFQSENSVSTLRPVEQQQQPSVNSKPKKTHSTANKNANQQKKNKSSVNKNSLNNSRANSNSKLSRGSETLEQVTGQPVLTSSTWKSGLSGAKRNNNKINNQKKKQRPKVSHPPQTELPLELWKLLDENENNRDVLTNVDFDSYLAETEEMLAHPAEVINDAATVASADEYSPSPVTITATNTAQRSTFIHRESGGWEEVIVNQSDPAVVSPILPEEDDDLMA